MSGEIRTKNRAAFWQRHPGLVWSNPQASDEVFISAALRKARFLLLLDLAVEFGTARLRRQWEVEKLEGRMGKRPMAWTEENLRLIEESYARHASTRDV